MKITFIKANNTWKLIVSHKKKRISLNNNAIYRCKWVKMYY